MLLVARMLRAFFSERHERPLKRKREHTLERSVHDRFIIVSTARSAIVNIHTIGGLVSFGKRNDGARSRHL